VAAVAVVATATTAANPAIFLAIAPSLAVVEADSEAVAAVVATATTAGNPAISLEIARSPDPVADVAALIGSVTSAKVMATSPAIAPPNCHVERVFPFITHFHLGFLRTKYFMWTMCRWTDF